MDQVTADALKVTAEAGIDIDFVKGSTKYRDWIASIDTTKFVVNKVHLQSVDVFNKPDGSRVMGFIKLVADITDTNGKRLPGIVFMRGGAVGMLVVLNKNYAVLTVQPRLATGDFQFVELPAGMLDGSGNFAGVAAKEIEEELGMKIAAADLKELGCAIEGNRGIFLSPGGSDETMRLFYHEAQVSDEDLAAIQGRCTGLLDEGEQITLKVVPLDDLWTVADAKTIISVALYKQLTSTAV